MTPEPNECSEQTSEARSDGQKFLAAVLNTCIDFKRIPIFGRWEDLTNYEREECERAARVLKRELLPIRRNDGSEKPNEPSQ